MTVRKRIVIIGAVVNAAIVEARPDRLAMKDGTEHAFDFGLVIPALIGSPFLRGAEGLSNPRDSLR